MLPPLRKFHDKMVDSFSQWIFLGVVIISFGLNIFFYLELGPDIFLRLLSTITAVIVYLISNARTGRTQEGLEPPELPEKPTKQAIDLVILRTILAITLFFGIIIYFFIGIEISPTEMETDITMIMVFEGLSGIIKLIMALYFGTAEK